MLAWEGRTAQQMGDDGEAEAKYDKRKPSRISA